MTDEIISPHIVKARMLSQSKDAIRGRKQRNSLWYKEWRKKYDSREDIKERRRIFNRKLRAHPKTKQYHKEYQRRYREKHRIRYTSRVAILRAKKNGLPFDLEFMKALGETHPTHCPCCNITLNYKFSGNEHGPLFDGPSLDRIDTLGGYTKGNVEIICWRCNAIKRDATLDELEKIVAYMRKKLL